MAQYPTLEFIMQLARPFIGDSYNGGAGELLTDAAPYTIPYINAALSELQDRLENNASVTLTKDNVLVLGLEAVGNPDPSIQTSLSYTGYNNGTSIDTNLVLPADLMAPEVLWERQSGTTNSFIRMNQPMEGLPSRTQTEWLRDWVWQTDAINFVGATTARDIRIRYRSRQNFIVPGTDFSNVTINVLGCERAMAYLIGYHFNAPRNAENTATLRAEADAAILQLLKRIVRQKQGIQYIRPPYSDGTDAYSVRLPW